MEIFSVNPATGRKKTAGLPAQRLLQTLARHGINVVATSAHADKAKAGEIIENRLSDNSVDLLVMGAYTHSRLWGIAVRRRNPYPARIDDRGNADVAVTKGTDAGNAAQALQNRREYGY